MKYILLILILILSGCNNKEINLNNIQNIKFKNINIMEEDFDYIIENLNGNYKEIDNIPNEYNIIEIIDKDNINSFYITKTNIYTKSNNKYYIKNQNNFLHKLNELALKYKNNNILNIQYKTEFIYDENKFNIKLDNTNNNYTITLSDTIYDFKIHKIQNNEIVDLLYDANVVDSREIVIRTDDEIKINFETKYNLLVTISKNNNKLEIKTKNKN